MSKVPVYAENPNELYNRKVVARVQYNKEKNLGLKKREHQTP